MRAPALFSISAPSDQTDSISSGIPSILYSRGIPIVFPFTLPPRNDSKSGTGTSADVESFGSWPAIASSMMAASRTDFVKGPA